MALDHVLVAQILDRHIGPLPVDLHDGFFEGREDSAVIDPSCRSRSWTSPCARRSRLEEIKPLRCAMNVGEAVVVLARRRRRAPRDRCAAARVR
jgi:hypothetical protein